MVNKRRWRRIEKLTNKYVVKSQNGKYVSMGETVKITGDSYGNALEGYEAKILGVSKYKNGDGSYDVTVYGTKGEQGHRYSLRQVVSSFDIKKLK